MSDPRPIAVYDSGVGGLTVARAILDLVPNEPLLYLGDTARAPYGPRPVEEIRSFALEIAGYLVAREVGRLTNTRTEWLDYAQQLVAFTRMNPPDRVRLDEWPTYFADLALMDGLPMRSTS